MTPAAAVLSLSAFPQCVPAKQQRVEIEINGQLVAGHQWTGCEPWSADIPIPASILKTGKNGLVVRTAYAISPAELSLGANADARQLSIGFSKLRIAP